MKLQSATNFSGAIGKKGEPWVVVGIGSRSLSDSSKIVRSSATAVHYNIKNISMIEPPYHSSQHPVETLGNAHEFLPRWQPRDMNRLKCHIQDSRKDTSTKSLFQKDTPPPTNGASGNPAPPVSLSTRNGTIGWDNFARTVDLKKRINSMWTRITESPSLYIILLHCHKMGGNNG